MVAAKSLNYVDAMADELASGATQAIRWANTIVNLERRRINAVITYAALAYETLTNDSVQHQESVNAFVAKRAPQFIGE